MKNLNPIVSFTFDDFPKSALHVGGSILSNYGVKGTYYAAFGLMNSLGPTGEIFGEDDLLSFENGIHELGCHTYYHSDSWETSEKSFLESIQMNRDALVRFLPNLSFESFSFPITVPSPRNKKVASKFFRCSRSGGQAINQRELDINALNSFFIEKSRDNLDDIKRIIDSNASNNGWLILSSHDISSKPTEFGCTPEVFLDVVRYANASGAAILPVNLALKAVLGD